MIKLSKEREGQEQLLAKLARSGKERFLNRLPMPAHHFRELLAILDEQFQTEICDRSFAFTEKFLKERHLEEDKVIVWLEENGWYCDCEVLRNVSSAS